MNVRRGLIAASVGAVLGAALTVFIVFSVHQEDPFAKRNFMPLVICPMLLACSAWATWAPNGKHSLGMSMTVIALFSTIVIGVLLAFIFPQRSRSDPPIESRPFDFSICILILFFAPVLPTAWLTRRRIRWPGSII